MTRPQSVAEETATVLAAAGIVSTPEGRARARARLDAAKERMTSEALEGLRERFRPGYSA